jgi:hypothetical protein
MKKALCFLLALHVGCALAVDAAAPRTHYTPGAPGIRLYQSFDTDRVSEAQWRGKLTLTGKLIVLFNGDFGSEPVRADGFAIFEPDLKSRERVPAAIDRFPCQALWFWLAPDPQPLLLRVLGRKGAAKVLHGKSNRYEMNVTLRTDAIETTTSGLMNGNGRSYSIENPILSGHKVKVLARPTRTFPPAQDLPFCP